MISFHKFQMLLSKCMLMKQFRMRNIDKGILKACYEENWTCDFADSLYGFELADLEICGFLFPYFLLNMLLDAVNCSFHEKGRQERRVLVA